jgi:hypothetical protein
LGPARKWSGDDKSAVEYFRSTMQAALRLPAVEQQFRSAWSAESAAVIPTTKILEVKAAPIWSSLIAWAAMEMVGRCCDPADPDVVSSQLFDAMRLREVMAESFAAAGAAGEDRWRAAARIRASFAHAPWMPTIAATQSRSSAVFSWLHDPDVAWLIGVHEWEGVRYFNKEAFERLLWWMSLRSLIGIAADPNPDPAKIKLLENEIASRLKAAADAGYRVEALLQAGSVRQPTTPAKAPQEASRTEEPVKK